jgi:hypothetical protein
MADDILLHKQPHQDVAVFTAISVTLSPNSFQHPYNNLYGLRLTPKISPNKAQII